MNVFGLTKSCLKVLEVLSGSPTVTQKMIKDSTKLSSRTVKYALKTLVDRGLVQEKKSFVDMRQKLYSFCPWL